MDIINGIDLDTLNKIAEGYEAMEGTRLGLKQKDGVSDDVLNEAKAALQKLMGNGLIFNLNKSVEPRHSERRQEMRNIIGALNLIKEGETPAEEKAQDIPQEEKTDETPTNAEPTNDGTPGPQERMAAIIGPAFYQYDFKFENGRITSTNAPQDVMIDVYARLRDINAPITVDMNENGDIIALRGLRQGEQPAQVVTPNTPREDIQATNDISTNWDYQDFSNEKSDAAKKTDQKDELAIIGDDAEESEDKDINIRLNERFKSNEGLERLNTVAKEFNALFKIDGDRLIANDYLSSEDYDFAKTSVEYFYPVESVKNDAGEIVGLKPMPGYEPLAQILYNTMRTAARAEDFAVDMAKKKADEDANIEKDEIDYAAYVNDYLYNTPSNTSDENEIFYMALLFTALQAVKPADQRKKYSDLVAKDAPFEEHENVVANEYARLNDKQRAILGNVLNDVNDALLQDLPPKNLVQTVQGLSTQLAQKGLSDEVRADLTTKLNAVYGRMDEMINDVADQKVVFDSSNYLQLAENYEGLKAVIDVRIQANPKATLADEILAADIAAYDSAFGLEDLTPEDAEILMNRAKIAENVLVNDETGDFTISDETVQRLKGIVYTDENGEVVPQVDDKGNVLAGSLIHHMEELAVAAAYNQAILGKEEITRKQMQETAEDFLYNAVVNLVKADMDAKGLDTSDILKVQDIVDNLSPEKPYQTSVLTGTTGIATQVQSMVGIMDRMGQKIGREAPVLRSMHDRIRHLDNHMANSRFKDEYVKSNRFINTVTSLGKMAAMTAAYGVALNFGGAALGVGLIAGMTAVRTFAGYTKQKREARLENRPAKGFLSYVWSEKAQIASTAASITAIAGGLAWLSYSAAAVNLVNNFRRNLNRDHKAGQLITMKDGLKNGLETGLPMAVSMVMNIGMQHTLFADHGDPNASFLDNLTSTFSDAFSGIKDVLGFGDAAAGITPDVTPVDHSAAHTTAPSDTSGAPADTTGTDTAAAGGSDAPAGTPAQNTQDLPPVNAHTVVPPTSAEIAADSMVQATEHVVNGNQTPANTTPNDMPRVEDLPNLNTHTGTPPLGDSAVGSATAGTDSASNTGGTPTSSATTQGTVSGINVPDPALENQTPPPDATYVDSPANYEAQVAANEAAQNAAQAQGGAGTADTTTVHTNAQANATGTDTTTTPGDNTGTTDTTNAAQGSQTHAAPTGTENIPDAQPVHHTYDQAAHDHASARIHGEGIQYKLDYNEAQLDGAVNQIRAIGENYPQMTGVDGQDNAEILMYKLNQAHQLIAPDTDIVTPDGTRVEAQAYYGHKMPDGSYYGPNDLRADLLAGKPVDPQIAAEIFAKLEPHIDAQGHHIGDIHNFKEEGTWSYRKTGVGGYSEDVAPQVTPQSDGITGHLDENNHETIVEDKNPAPVPPSQNQAQDNPVPPVTGTEQGQGQDTPQTSRNDSQDVLGVPTPPNEGAPFVPYIPYDKPYEKVRRTMRERIGAWMDPVKRALGVKGKKEDDAAQTPVAPQTGDKGADKTVDALGKRPVSYSNHDVRDLKDRTGAPNANGVKAPVQTGIVQAPQGSVVQTPQGVDNTQTPTQGSNGQPSATKLPQVGINKRLVTHESDLPKDPYSNFTPISENVDRDVNGAWVADFRDNAPKINRTVKTANADYVTGKLPNTPQKGEIQPTVIPMGGTSKQAQLGLQDSTKGLPEPEAIRLGTERVSDKTIYLGTKDQDAAMKRYLFDGNVPKHIRKALEEKARQDSQPQKLLENKEGNAKLTPEQARALLDKYRDVTQAVDDMKNAPVTQNSGGANEDVSIRSSKGRVQKPQQTQTGANGQTSDAKAAVWKHVTRNHKEP